MIVESSTEEVVVPFQRPGSVVPASCDPAVGNSIPRDEYDGSSGGPGFPPSGGEEVLLTTGLFFGRSDCGNGSEGGSCFAGALGAAGGIDGPFLPAVSRGIGIGMGVGRCPVPDGINIGRSDPLGGSNFGGDDTDGGSGSLLGMEDNTSGDAFAGNDRVSLNTWKERVSHDLPLLRLLDLPRAFQLLEYFFDIPGPSLLRQFPRRCHCNDRVGSAASECATSIPDMKRANDRRIMER